MYKVPEVLMLRRKCKIGFIALYKVQKQKDRIALQEVQNKEIVLLYLLTYSLHGAESFLRSELVLQLIKKFPAFYGTPKFITVLTSARHLSLSWANSIQSPQPIPTSWRSILILSSHLRLGLPNGLFPSGFPHQNLVHNSPFLHMCHMPRPSHSSRFYQPYNIGRAVQIVK